MVAQNDTPRAITRVFGTGRHSRASGHNGRGQLAFGRETDEHRLRFEFYVKGLAYLRLHQVLQLQQIGGSSTPEVHQRQRMFAGDSYGPELKAPEGLSLSSL